MIFEWWGKDLQRFASWEKGILDEGKNKNKGSRSGAVAGIFISLKKLARALPAFLGDVHSDSCCICWLTQLPTEDAACPAYFIIYSSNPRLELNTLPYSSSTTRDFFFWLVDSLIESIIYSFYKYLWSTYYMPCTLVATGHTAVSQETAALMNLPF